MHQCTEALQNVERLLSIPSGPSILPLASTQLHQFDPDIHIPHQAAATRLCRTQHCLPSSKHLHGQPTLPSLRAKQPYDDRPTPMDHFAPVIDINVTGICNLRCGYCFGEFDNRGEISRTHFAVALRFARALNSTHIQFCGGEPLAYKHLSWAIALAKERGFDLILRTNGLLLARRRTLVAENFHCVAISLDGDPHTNHKLRPPIGKKHVDEESQFQLSFNEFFELRRTNPCLRLVLASVATAQNVDGIIALANIVMTRQPPIDSWKIYQFVPNHFRAANNIGDFHLTLHRFNDLKFTVENVIKGTYELIFRDSIETHQSCVIIDTLGNVVIGGVVVGNLQKMHLKEIIMNRDFQNALEKTVQNKTETYKISSDA